MLVHVWGPAGSLVFHVVAIGVLLTCVGGPATEPEVGVTIDFVPPPKDPMGLEPVVNPRPEPTTPQTSEAQTTDEPDVLPRLVRDEMPKLPDDMPDGRKVERDGSDGSANNEVLNRTEISVTTAWRDGFSSYTDRSQKGKQKGLEAYNPHPPRGPKGTNGPVGITEYPTERAVLLSLRWLQHNQNSNGSWNGSAAPAMTAMALLAFLGHGETPKSPEFGTTVYKAIRWLIDNQDATGHFKGKDGNDYSQPIAAYALCEAYAMTQHPDLKEPASMAISAVVNGQQASGGFNYGLSVSTMRNDTSYAGWCLQALKAAKVAKLEGEVPGITAALKRGVAGLRLNADPSGGFGYDRPGRTGLSGVGVLGLQLLGASRSAEVASTMKFLEACTFKFDAPEKQPYAGSSPLYYWYYITQAKFHHDRETFLAWNRQFSTELCRRQIVEKVLGTAGKDGKPAEIGHWQSPSKSEHSGGVVQDTALCTLMLEVYYRYLPSYQKPEVLPDELAKTPASEAVNVRIR
jgi:hypothetical protein